VRAKDAANQPSLPTPLPQGEGSNNLIGLSLEVTMSENDDNKQENISLLSIISSTLWAAVGVQRGKNRERDFKSGKLLPFIIAGILFTAIFIGTVLAVVNVVLKNAGM
jgi:uncharacterized membrane protein YidH (DUF202 family)